MHRLVIFWNNTYSNSSWLLTFNCKTFLNFLFLSICVLHFNWSAIQSICFLISFICVCICLYVLNCRIFSLNQFLFFDSAFFLKFCDIFPIAEIPSFRKICPCTCKENNYFSTQPEYANANFASFPLLLSFLPLFVFSKDNWQRLSIFFYSDDNPFWFWFKRKLVSKRW